MALTDAELERMKATLAAATKHSHSAEEAHRRTQAIRTFQEDAPVDMAALIGEVERLQEALRGVLAWTESKTTDFEFEMAPIQAAEIILQNIASIARGALPEEDEESSDAHD